ncbi:hypothetical protein [Calothrix rhizosoleniae]|uniref:hypothetical protein n=1 Tax=Calothrix rhizosoleniae TaxID=888997 RepID=UPI000B4A40B6|nr:hypothetical protein [Calothrix rhizosoleniae]
MNTNNSCSCCGGFLLRHIRHGGVYWFCQECRQEIPLLNVSSLSGVVEGRNQRAITKEVVNS